MKDIPQNVKKIYFMGICGTGMGSLAGLLQSQGYEVSGSDEGIYPPMSDQLKALNIKLYTPFNPKNLELAKPDLVIVGNVMMQKYPESQALLASNIPYTSMPEAMKHFILKDKDVIVVAGTHGKTTTTSLMTFLLRAQGEDVGYFIGGVSKDFGLSFHVGQSRYFVIEGDEYDTAFFEKTPKFIHYNPKHVIMTSLEFDHADIYQNLDQIIQAFNQLSLLIPKEGSLHYCHDWNTLHAVSALCKAKVYGYGFNPEVANNSSMHLLKNYIALDQGSQFEWATQGQPSFSIQSPLFGQYNAANVAAAFSVLEHLGFDLNQSIKHLASFKGVKRRQDVLYQDHQLVVLDDFAHHPTAVAQTLVAIKEKYPKHKLVAVFEPRSNTSLRDIFQNDYASSFDAAHEVHFPPVLNAHKVKEGKVLDMQKLSSDITQRGVTVFLHKNTQDLIEHLIKHLKKPTAILIMSNGSFENIHQRIIETYHLENEITVS